MKTYLFAILLFCSWSLYAKGQTQERSSIARDKIVILNSSGKKYALGGERQLYAAFGHSKKVKNNNEMIEHQGYTYSYNGLEVYFNGKDWDATAINNKNYKLSLAGKAYAIGDDITKLQTQFPLSFKNRYRLDSKTGAIWIFINNADAYISIRYDLDRKIKEIWLGYDNS